LKFTAFAIAALVSISVAGVSQAGETNSGRERTHDAEAGTNESRLAKDAKGDPASTTQGNSDAKSQPKAADTGSDEKNGAHPHDGLKADHSHASKAALPDDGFVPPGPNRSLSRLPGGMIDKKTAGAIGLIRPHVTKAGVTVVKNRATTTPSNLANNFGNRGKTPVTGAAKTAFINNGRLAQGTTPAGTATADLRGGTVTRGDTARGVATLSTQARAMGAVHDAILNGTGIKRPAAVLASIGGAVLRKPTAAIINGTEMHAKRR
jgi:hypothetical protein